MKTLFFLLSLLVGAQCLFGARCAIAETKISTVDVNRVLNESKEAKGKKKEIDDKASAVRKKIEVKKAALMEMDKKLKEEKVSDTSPEAEKFRDQARDFERYVRDNDEELKKDFMKLNKELTEKTLKVIAAYAKEHKIDLVLDKGDVSRSPLLYSESSSDITDDILKKINS